jgi:VWFA-related protein
LSILIFLSWIYFLKEVVLFLVLASVACFASDQGVPAGQSDIQMTIRATSTLVAVPAVVRSASGVLIADLAAGDFRVSDNGVERKVRAERVSGEPIAVVVLMQTGGGAPRQFQNYSTLNTLVTAMMGASDHRVGLVTFDSRIQQIWNFPPRIDGLKYAFRNPEGGDHGAAILDALNCGIGLLEHQPASFRRVILLLSQTCDEGSKMSAAELLRRLGESNTTVYSVTFPSSKKEERSGRKPLLEGQRYSQTQGDSPLEAAVQAMRADTADEAAALSGGEHARLKKQEDLDRSLSVLANDFANSYLLSFHPGSEEPGFHWIRVEVANHPNQSSRLAVEARSIYWSGDDGAEE